MTALKLPNVYYQGKVYYSNVREVTCHLIWPSVAAVFNSVVVMCGTKGMIRVLDTLTKVARTA